MLSFTRPQWRRISRQTNALLYKNFLVFYKSPFTTLARALIFPLLVTLIMCLLRTINSNHILVPDGIATTPTRVLALPDAINNSGSRKLVFVRNGISKETLSPIIDRISSLPGMQHIQTHSTDNPADLYTLCKQTIEGFSDCFAAVVFEAYSDSAVNYTIALDSGVTDNYYTGNFINDNSVTATHLLPLQWALNSHIGNFSTSPRPFLNPYSGIFGPQADPFAAERGLFNSFWLNTVATFTGPLFILILIGITYHLSTFVATERESSMAELMAAQTVSTVPRILSTLISFFVLYLPGMVIASVLMTQLLFTHTNDAILLLLTILGGASITVSSHFVASFFSKAQLAGLYASILTFALALVTLSATLSNTPNKLPQVLALSLIFPPATWVIVIVEIANVEYKVKGFSLLSALAPSEDTLHGSYLAKRLQMLDGYTYAIFFLIQIIAYGFGTYAIEQRLWGVTRTFNRIAASSDIAVRCTSLSKTYATKNPWYRPFKAKGAPLVAVDHLNLEVKKGSVTFLLGPNGGGKTTTIKCIAGITSMDAGSHLELNEAGVVFGICPQNNVLWENLTVEENIRIWRKLKTAAFEDLAVDEDDVLAECDLVCKAKATAKTLSGGQMRKLQLAISFVGGSKVCCIDEASSGLDPLSRRNIWNIIQKGHSRRTILVTTHFLDEADVLADHIAIVYKGKMVCEGPSTSLKARFGNDYVIRSESDARGDTIVWRTSNSAEATRKVLELEALSPNTTYDVVFPTLEQVFLKVTSDTAILEHGGDGIVGTEEETMDVIDEKIFALEQDETRDIDLETSRSIGLLRQVYALLAKRYTLFLQKATWIAYGINLIIPIFISGALYGFIHTKAPPLQLCQTNEAIMRNAYNSLDSLDLALYPIPALEQSLAGGAQSQLSPAVFSVLPRNNYTTVIGPPSEWSSALQESIYISSLSGLQVDLGSTSPLDGNNVTDSSSAYQAQLLLDTRLFANSTGEVVTSISNVAGLGFSGFGIYAPTPESAVLFYDTSTSMMYVNLEAFSLITNRIANSVTNGTSRATTASVRAMVHVKNSVDPRSMPIATLLTLSFIAAASIAVIYPAFEKINRVRALHYCNGVSPFALWLAYLLFDTQFIIIQALIVWGLLFTSSVSDVWYEPGYLLGAFILFGIATYLGTYVLSLFVRKAAFAIAAGVHMVLFVLYLAAYIMNQSLGPAAHRDENYSFLQFGLGLSSPAANLGRALFIATNSFDILCGKYGDANVANGFAYVRYGSVYANLLIQIIFLIAFLSIYEYGSADWIRRHITHRGVPSRLHYIVDTDSGDASTFAPVPTGPHAEKITTSPTTAPPPPILTVSRVSKFFGRTFATENISFSIRPNTTLALLGGNGAGKTTMVNMIRGELSPSYGEIHVDGISALKNPRKARLRMGVCPQDDAVDNLTVGQTLRFYARVKGVRDVERNTEIVMEALNIAFYRGVLVGKLSGGTKRKLSVAIALLGNPPILLLDEPSTGQDAGAKRILWRALQSVRSNRAILLTTHSMEEAEALASNVAIMGTRMLAMGTLAELGETHGGAFGVRAVRPSSGGNGGGDEREAREAERKIKNAFEEQGIKVWEYVDKYGQVEFKLVHDRALLGRIMSVLEGLKGEPVNSTEGGGAGGSSGAGGARSGSAVGGSAKGERVDEKVLQEYTVTGPTLEEVFMNVAKQAGNLGASSVGEV